MATIASKLVSLVKTPFKLETATLDSAVNYLAALRFCLPHVADLVYRVECRQEHLSEQATKQYKKCIANLSALCRVQDSATRINVQPRAFFMRIFARKYSVGLLEKLADGKFNWLFPTDFIVKDKVLKLRI